MSDNPCIIAQSVGKEFHRGVGHDSLRDLIPALTRRLLRRRKPADPNAFWALRDVNFNAMPGEALGIIGPNGAGKSTMLKLLSGILKPDEGAITVNGRISSLIEVGAGFHFDLTGRENVYLNGAILGMSKREIDAKFDEIVAFAELPDFIDTPLKRYSSGMQARLGFSVAAHMDPQVLLVDEVLSVGDYHFQTKCLDKMRQFIKDGVTVIFVSHNMQAVGALCSRCVLLDKGRVSYAGDPKVAIQAYYADRHGSTGRQEGRNADKVRVESVQLEDAHGCPAATFKNGDRALLRARIQSDISAKVSIGMVLRNATGMVLSDTATTRVMNDPVELQPGRPLDVSFEFSIRFCPGNYGLSINIEDPLTSEYHLYAYDLEKFVVTDGQACGGFCFIEPIIHVTSDATPDPVPAASTKDLEPDSILA